MNGTWMNGTNPSAKARIMIVDDDPDVGQVLAEVLADQGFLVRQEAGGHAVLEILQKVKVDLLVTDLIMPNQTGMELIVNVRKLSPDVRIIAISGGGRVHDSRFLELAKKAGADLVLQKPIDINNFVESVEKVLSSPSGQ